MDPLPPIPTPAGQRWREFRIRVLPVIMFLCILMAVVFLWRGFVQPVGVVGEVEAVKASVTSPGDGKLSELSVDRFQKVTNSQPIGQVIQSHPDTNTVLEAPLDGVVGLVFRRAGENVIRGEPILTINSARSERIVAYIRQPVPAVLPTTNDTVQVRTRSLKRQTANAQILKVGAQMEPIKPALLSTDSTRVEVGLPILVSLPPGLRLLPGEFVDLAIHYSKR